MTTPATDLTRGVDHRKYGFRPAHQIFSDGSGYFRWVGRGTWISEFNFLPVPGTRKHEERRNYRVFTNYPIGFPADREPWTVANHELTREPILDLAQAMKFARQYEEQHLPNNPAPVWLHPGRFTG